jgi:hypothetical protein
MNLLSADKKLLYIHIPKNGGHSIVDLVRNRPPHKWTKVNLPLTAKDIVKHSIDLDTSYVFTFVRNPYTRFLSGWKNLYHKYVQKTGIRYSKSKDFNATKEYFARNYKRFDNNVVDCDIHLNYTQTQHLNVVLEKTDKFYRFENFNEEYAKLSNRLYGIDKIPTKRFKSPIVTPYTEWFTPQIISYVNDKFHDDFVNFNYQKD